MSEEQERISHAAAMSETGWIFIGKNHANCLHKMFNIGIKAYRNSQGQGFVTSKGRFVSREKAAKMAFDAGQIDKIPSLLFSEHLWSKQYDAKHDYDEVKGYVKKDEE